MMWTNCYRELAGILQGREAFINAIPDAYADIRQRLADAPVVQRIDLWHGKAGLEGGGQPLPSPTLFIDFSTLGVRDGGQLTQQVLTQVDLYLYYVTDGETYMGAATQTEALAYLDVLTLYGMMLHGRSGEHFGTLCRKGVYREEPGGAGRLYRLAFECEMPDYSSMEWSVLAEMKNREVSVGGGLPPEAAQATGEWMYDVS